MEIWDGLVTTLKVTRLLRVSPYRLREVAGQLGLKSLNSMWDVADVKKIALRLVVIGTPEERATAKEALMGSLRGSPKLDPWG